MLFHFPVNILGNLHPTDFVRNLGISFDEHLFYK